MRNIRLLIEYDGTDFHGWQRQPDGLRTVQGEIERAVATVFGRATAVTGAGRTDAGVHALGYVCNFHVESRLPIERVTAALQANLPDDIAVRGAVDAPPDFHARFDALSRRYAYHLYTARTAVWRRAYHTPRYRIDPGAMAEACAQLVGRHDFTSFTPSGNDADPVCNMLEARVDAEGLLVTITVEADRFLHNMVRIIAGTLIEVGRGRYGPEHVHDILCRKDRTAAGPTAPPHGLALVAVRYPEPRG